VVHGEEQHAGREELWEALHHGAQGAAVGVVGRVVVQDHSLVGGRDPRAGGYQFVGILGFPPPAYTPPVRCTRL